MGTEVTVTRGALATMLAAAERAAPAECCGILLGEKDTIAEARPAANVAAEPLTRFEIDPAALIAAHRAARAGGAPISGYFHSHPNGHPRPSATDCAHAGGDNRVWAIVANRAIHWFRDTPQGFTPLSSRVVEG
jgi:proteasome lid subunit RPN8/RPN11